MQNGIDAVTSRRLADEAERLLKSNPGTIRGVRVDPVEKRIEIRTLAHPQTWQPVNNERSER